jgi:hypothetical protein
LKSIGVDLDRICFFGKIHKLLSLWTGLVGLGCVAEEVQPCCKTGLAVLLSRVWLAVPRNWPGYVAKSAWLCCKKRLGCVPNRPSWISRVSKPFHSAFLPFAASSVVVLTCVFHCVLWYLLSTSCHQLVRVCSRWDFWGGALCQAKLGQWPKLQRNLIWLSFTLLWPRAQSFTTAVSVPPYLF